MFPEELLNQLPPNGMSVVIKAILYLTILYVLIFSLFMRSLLQSRLKRQANYGNVASAGQRASLLSFDRDISDVLTALRVEIAGYEASLKVLEEAHQEHTISDDSYTDLKLLYMKKIEQLTEEIADYNNADIETLEQELSNLDLESESISVSASSDELSELEALTQQLTESDELGLEELSPPAPPSIQAPTAPAQATEVSATSTSELPPPSPPTIQPPSATPSASPTVSPPTPPPPTQNTGSLTPPAPPAAPSTAPMPSLQPTPPTPTPPKAETVDLPPPSPPAAPPQPVPPTASTPTPAAASPTMPGTTSQSSEEGEEEGLFAKSTSIAALRMEMLRELARLKKFMSDQQ